MSKDGMWDGQKMSMQVMLKAVVKHKMKNDENETTSESQCGIWVSANYSVNLPFCASNMPLSMTKNEEKECL